MKRAGTWHPTFSLPLHPKMPHPVLSPALAPASGSTLRLIRSSAPGHKGPRFSFRTGLRQAVPRSNFPSMAEPQAAASPIRSEDLFHAIPPRHPTGLVRSMKDVRCVSSSTRLRPTEVFPMPVSENTWTASPMSFRSGFSPLFQAVKPSIRWKILAVPMPSSCARSGDSSSRQSPTFPPSPDSAVEGGGKVNASSQITNAIFVAGAILRRKTLLRRN